MDWLLTQTENAGPTATMAEDKNERRPLGARDLSSQAGDFSLRPTLVIGLGGTGHRIVVHLKARFIRAYGDIPPLARLLVFDTADETLTVSVDGELVGLTTGDELFNIGNTPVPNIIRNIDRQSAIAARLPGIHALPLVALRAGAKQVRPLGLLALLWRYDEVEGRIQDAIWELSSKDNLSQRAGATHGINVFICNSLVGGTGSGTFLDVAHLVRAILDEMGTLGDFCYVTGVGVLPQAFRNIDGPNIVPNTVAALKELSHCMLEGGFACEYPSGRSIHSTRPPFNLYYLIDAVDEQGYTWRGLDVLCAMIAEGLFLQVGSQVGRKGENDFDNLDEVLSRQTERGEGTFCGSFGMAALHFPARQVATWCSLRLAKRVVDEGLLRPADVQAVNKEVDTFTRALSLDVDALRQELAQDGEGVPIAVDLRCPAWLRQSKLAHVPQETIQYVQDYARVRLRGDYRAWIQANRTALQARLNCALNEQILAALSHPAQGVEHALVLADAFDERLRALERTLEARRATAEGERGRLEEELAMREEVLRRAPHRGILFRGRIVSTARDRYLDVAGRCFAQALQEMVAEMALALLSALRQALGEETRTLALLRSRLRSVGQHLAEVAERLIDSGAGLQVTSIHLADLPYCQQLYQEHAPPLEQTLVTLLNGEDLTAWSDLNADDIANRLCAAASPPFRAVAELTVEDVLVERAAEMSPQARKELLLHMATPSWNLDATRLQDGGAHLKNIQVMGVRDEGHSIYQDDAHMLASTHDPDTVIVFSATIGAPFTALQRYPEYERVYEAVRHVRPLHVLPQFQSDSEQARLAFALGTIFDMIFNRGRYFYYRPADELDPPIKLGNGLANAIHCFGSTDALVQEVMDRVERHIEAIGTAQAIEILSAYYTRSGEGEVSSGGAIDDVVIEMRKLVRAYTQDLRQTQWVMGSG